jgi:uncharacterized tellurite resistance protein B-like protein
MLNELNTDEKLRLLRFVCSFAWADLEIADKERNLVRDIAKRMGLEGDDLQAVEGWLDHPPSEDDLDPYDIPDAHRKLFLGAVQEMVKADGVLDLMEIETYQLFEALLAGEDDPAADDDPVA